MAKEKKKKKKAAPSAAASSSAAAAPAAGEPAAKKAKFIRETVAARVVQKLNENFKTLSSMEQDVLVDPTTDMTLRQRLTEDVDKRERGDQSVQNHTTKLIQSFVFVFVLFLQQASASRSGVRPITTS